MDVLTLSYILEQIDLLIQLSLHSHEVLFTILKISLGSRFVIFSSQSTKHFNAMFSTC